MTQLDLTPVTSRIAALLAIVDDSQLDDPTPMPAYNVRNLIDHLGTIAQAFTFAALKDRNELTERVPNDPSRPLAPDWRTAIPRDLETLTAAWAEPSAWDGTTRIAGSDSPAGVVGLVVTDELVIHGWDLARSLGADYEAEPELIAASKQFLDMVVNDDLPPGDDVAFGPPKPVAADATPLEEILALCGRQVNWSR
jgi:uncharacterized protein (TIGR03086 family)